MPGAGFYSIPAAKLSFRSDGRWYADDEPVVHQRLARLFSRYLRRKSSGGYEIWIDERYHADVDIEDTPYAVSAVDRTPQGEFVIELQDGTTEVLDAASLEIGDRHVLYCRVKGGLERARFLRPAYYQLAQFIDETGPGRFHLRCGERTYLIAVH